MISAVLLSLVGYPPPALTTPQTVLGGATVVAPVKLHNDSVASETDRFAFTGSSGKEQYRCDRIVISDSELAPPNDMIGEFVKSFLNAAVGTTMLSTLPATLSGWPGLDCRIKGNDGSMCFIRVYAVGHSLYALTYRSTDLDTASRSSTFMNSLTLPKSTPNGPVPSDRFGWRSTTLAKSDLSIDFPAKPQAQSTPNPQAPTDTSLSIKKIELETPCEYLQAFEIPIPQELTDQMDSDKEFDAEEEVATSLIKGIGSTDWKRTERLDHMRTVLTYRFANAKAQSRGHVDIFRKGNAFYLIVFLGRDGIVGSEDEPRFFNSAKIPGY
jgi:hypothetical protein